MPDLQSPAPCSANPPVVIEAAPAPEDDGYALGWECANPALQIERWGQDGGSADAG